MSEGKEEGEVKAVREAVTYTTLRSDTRKGRGTVSGKIEGVEGKQGGKKGRKGSQGRGTYRVCLWCDRGAGIFRRKFTCWSL